MEEESVKRLTIKALAENDRPREKLMKNGRNTLSDAELLAILLGSGNTKETAVQLAQRMLAENGNNLNAMAKLSHMEMKKFPGVGEAKALVIAAAFELGRRRNDANGVERPKITGSYSAYQILHPKLSDLPHEEFWVLILDRANQVIREEYLSRGGISGTVVDVRLICRLAIENGASGIVIGHNHPSGEIVPSEQDRSITRKLKEGLKILDVSLLDHLIIGDMKYYSFSDDGAL
jgi:DNA repair protein RadC